MQLTALLLTIKLNTNKKDIKTHKKRNVVCTPEQLYFSIFATKEKRNVNPNYMII